MCGWCLTIARPAWVCSLRQGLLGLDACAGHTFPVQRFRQRASTGTCGSFGCVCSFVHVGFTIKQRGCGIKHKQFAVESSSMAAAAWDCVLRSLAKPCASILPVLSG